MRHPEKFTSTPIMTAANLIEQLYPKSLKKSAPETVLIIMSGPIYEYAKGRIWGRINPDLPAKICMPHKWRSGPSLLGNIGVGGVSVVAHLEYLAAWGVKQFVLVGTAGGLTPSASYGDVVIPTKALRDEGVSSHYLPKDKWAIPSDQLNSKLTASLTSIQPKIHLAPVWTTAAPFRETKAEVHEYAAEGMVAVEMEAASLFAAAQALGVATAAVLTISDSLATGTHQIAPRQQIIKKTQQMVCDQLIKLFQK